MTIAHINEIATAIPAHDIHQSYIQTARRLIVDPREERLFRRMATLAGIDHRYSVFAPASPGAASIDREGFYRLDAMPGTGDRMTRFVEEGFALAMQAIGELAGQVATVTHFLFVSCTGFVAPGLDQMLAAHFRLSPSIERTSIGFMGCAAAVNALKFAHHIVRSAPSSRVLIVNLELCTLHFRQSGALDTLLSELLFADGCAACLVSAAPHGLALLDFRSTVVAESEGLLGWKVGTHGFEMNLSGELPQRLSKALADDGAQAAEASLLHGKDPAHYRHWAVHPGGRTVLDAVERAYDLPAEALAPSRETLRDYGNMSSATLMFILRRLLTAETTPGMGMAMAFGPGLVAESFRFRVGSGTI